MDDKTVEDILDFIYDKRDSYDFMSVPWRTINNLIVDLEEKWNEEEE